MNRRVSNPSSNRRGHPPSSLSLLSSNNPSSSSTTVATANSAPVFQPKQTISVEEWERKTPLTDLQVRTVAKIAKASERVPLPLKFTEPSGKTPPGTPTLGRLVNKHLQPGSRPSTPGLSGVPRHALHPSHPIQTPQQFYDWFTLVDRSAAHNQESHYRAHLASLDEHLSVCDLLLDRIEEVEREVDSMLDGWRGVEEGGKNLKGACERLLEERDNLLQIVDDIGSHLDYFQELEHATRMLNHPGQSLIFQPDFHYMVERVNISIEFLKGHRHYRETEVYLLRFHQCMTRAMTLIKMNFVGSLRALSSEISKRISEGEVSSTAQHHLLYTRFKTVSTKVAPLIREFERRAQDYPNELGSLLSECHTAYFSVRRSLLVPRILEEIKGLDPSRSELVELTRSGCSYLKQLCTDEFDLYSEFFSSGEGQLYQYLETLCDLLYDDLRPRILHEPRLTVLCEVCTVLQALMVLDATSTPSVATSVASSDTSGDEDESDLEEERSTSRWSSDGSRNMGRRRLHTGQLLKMVLQDAQTRLFFKAQAVVQSEVRHYVPSADDLKWPDILLAANKPTSSSLLQEKQSASQIFHNISSLERQDTWYPSVRRTVWVLSQLRNFVKPAIFEDIAQETLSVCQISLVAASDLIKTQQGKALDAALFLVRHLLILKEVLASLEVDLRSRIDERNEVKPKTPTASRTLEFGGISATVGGVGGVTETLTNMLSKTTSLIPEGLFASLGVARGPESDLRGVKMDIDQTLRKACEDVITACSQPISEPLESWVNHVNALNESTKATLSTSARNPAGAAAPVAPPNLETTVSQASHAQIQFFEAVERDLRPLVAKVKLYLDDARTVKILLEHIVGRIEGMYERFGDAVFGVKHSGLVHSMGDSSVEILSSSGLREILRDVGGDASLSFARS